MKSTSNSFGRLLAAMIFITLSFLCDAQEITSVKNLTGSWEGALKVQGTSLRLVINISFNKADSMMVTLDSPDQGATGIATSKVEVIEDSIFIFVRKIGGKFSGRMEPGLTFIDGKWSQGNLSLPLRLARIESPVTLNRPQEPKPPFSYGTVEVTFHNKDAGIDLAGTLTIPENEGKYPVVILVSGSGPQDRDETLMGHKPFLVLSDYLTRNGLAVLRFDDRGVGKSGGIFKTATTLDFATDANAAVDFLKTYPEIDTSRMGILGHSEGGLVASIVASARKDVRFIMLLAGPGLTGEKILETQAALIARAEGSSEEDIIAAQRLNKDIYTVLKKNKDDVRAIKKIRSLIAAEGKKHASDTSYHRMSEEELTLQVETLTSAWFRCFLTLNPETYLSKVSCPILAINGSLDLQVAPKENLEAIEKALIFGGNSIYLIEELPGLNHLFQTAITGSPSEYGKIDETISPVALDFIGRWVHTSVMVLK